MTTVKEIAELLTQLKSDLPPNKYDQVLNATFTFHQNNDIMSGKILEAMKLSLTKQTQ